MRISLAGRTAWEKRRIALSLFGDSSESKIEHSFVSWRVIDESNKEE